MNNIDFYNTNIHELRRSGWKVRVIHSKEKENIPPEKQNICSHITRIELRTPEGGEYVGVSYCSKKDNYNRKLGNNIALRRALINAGVTIIKRK